MIFENPTVQALAATLDSMADAEADGELPNGQADTRFEPMSTSGLSAADLAAVADLWSSSRDGTS
jgi:mycobactin peptide synthetase MbtE